MSITLQDYAKSLGIELPSEKKKKVVDVEAGKAGYEQYLADYAHLAEEDARYAELKSKENPITFAGMDWNLSPTTADDLELLELTRKRTDDAWRPTDSWSDDERWEFGEIYAQDKNAAHDYGTKINNEYKKKKKQAESERLSDWAKKNWVNAALATWGGNALNFVGGIMDSAEYLAEAFKKDGIPQKDYLNMTETANALHGGVSEKLNDTLGTLNEDIPLIGGAGVGDLYGVGTSMAQSVLSGVTGPVGMASQFGLGMANGVNDALARGNSTGQAMTYGTVCGVIEAVLEYVSIKKILGMTSAESVENLFTNILKQAGQEAGEEGVTSVLTELSDYVINGDKSTYQLRVSELVASGMSVEEAETVAMKETLEGIAYDTIAGGISGGVMGGGATTINRVNQQFGMNDANNAAYKTLSPYQQEMITEAKNHSETEKRAAKYEKKVSGGKELSGFELRTLASELSKAQRNVDVDAVRYAIVEQMKAEGLNNTQAKVLGEIALNKAIGNDISKVQEVMLKRNEAAMKVYNQISADVMSSDVADSDWARNTPIESLRAEKAAEKAVAEQNANVATPEGEVASAIKFNSKNIKGKFTTVDGKIVYKKSENSRLHTEGITSSLTREDVIELSAIEKIANALGIDIHVYETTVDDKGQRTYTDKDGNTTSDSGYYDPNNNSIHIDLHAGNNGEGTMLYTASHEVVHSIKENASEHFAALEELVTKELVKGGFSIEKLIEKQKNILKQNGWKGNEANFEEVAREEMVAEACQSFLASKNAVAEIQALKSENKGLWNALKRFFTSLFTKINKLYKETPPDAPEAKYIADMRGAVKNIRDAFMEGAVEAGKKANAKTTTTKKTAAKEVKSQARVTSEQDAAYLDAVKRGDMETAQRMVDEAAEKAFSESKIRLPDGKLRTVYHGTNTGDFTVFNPDFIGMSSGDDGFFGMGFYFAYSKGEAKYYGAKRIISAYLDLKNPFDFETELQKYKGEKASGGNAPDAVALMNFADKFEDIAKDITISVVENDSDTVKEISLAEFSKSFKDVIENKKFEYSEITNEYGEKETLVTADPKTYEYEYNGEKHTYKDYSFQKRFWGKPNRLDVAYEYLASSVYRYVDMIRRTRLILDYNREFTAALKKKGYDGAIQSQLGDEAVAFYPEQIKSADPVTYDDKGNVIPLSERFNEKSKDIRHKARSVDKYTEKEYNSFGWVRANEVLATDEYHNFTSEFSKAKTSKEYAEYKSDLDEYMISVGVMHGDKEGVKNKIVFAKGTMANPEITRIIEIDADNETFLSDEREYIYALEKQGIRTEADELFKVHTSINARSASSGKRSSNENAPNNNQLGADRGTGSGTAQKAESGIPENLPQYAVAQKFKDISGVTRNVRRLNGQFMVEGTKRKNYLFDSIEAAINAENESLISRYAKKNERSISWVKSKIAADPEFLYNKIRHKSRSSVTSGQYEQMKANLSHSKVYSKKSAMELVSKIAPGIRNRSFEALSDQLWEGLNSYTTTDERRAFATDMAEIFVDRMVVDTVVKHSEWDSAVERMAYLKPAINTIEFRDEDISELKYMLDKNYASLRSRWGYKTPSDGSFKRAYGLDEFISDLSREMPGMEHLAEMHPAEALVEVDKLYTDLQEQIKQKYESAYGDMSDAELNEIKQMISYEIMNAYTELGEKTKIAKYLEEKFTFYQSRIDYWKAENAKTHKISRWNGIISTKALQIRDLKKGAFYNATQHHQDVFKDSIEKLANIQWRGNLKKTQRVSEIFAELSKWYTMQNPMLYKKDADNNLYSDTMATYITKIADSKGAFDENTYAMIYDVMNHLYTMMRNYNKVFRAGRWEDAPDLVNEYLKIMEQTKRNRNALTRVQTAYNTEFLEPMAIARRADNYDPNGFFTQTMEDLRSASINASIGEMNLRREYDAFIDANKKYLTNAAKETVNYRGHEIPKLQIIGLYMTMKREHARAGLALNGFEYTKKNKWWDSDDRIYVKGYVTDGDNVTQETINNATLAEMNTIEKSLNATDKQYIAILEKLFNEDLKALKIERDMERQGYTNATLDYYYPIIRGAMAENIDTAKISDQNRATNSSFNKNTVKGAKQRLVIISADAMVNRHITDMCKYYYMSQAIENYNVLYNCDVSGNANDPLNIAKIVQENKVWEKDVAYFKQLVKDMQGIREPQTVAEKFIESMRGNYAKFALGLNLKVLFTQFSSMIAAGDVIGFDSILSKNALTVSTADLDKYCPLAEVRSYDKTVLKAMALTDKIGKFTEVFTVGISKVDCLVVSRLFAACQVEAQKLGQGELGTEENKIAAGKLLEKVIIETQQNSYATERSQAMRSKNELLKAITMFTADGMKVVSRMYDAFGELQAAKDSKDAERIKKAEKQLVKSVAVATNIAVYMTAVAWMFGLIYDREEEEDETGWDKMLHLTLEVIGNFISALPVVSELYDYMVNGFEVEGVAFDTFNNLLSGINNIRKDLESIVTQSGERTIEDINRDLRTLLYGVGQATGLPFRNVYNLARGIIGNTSSKAGYYLDSKFYKTNLSSDLDDALTRGDNSKANYIMGLLYGERVNKDVSDAQRDEIVRLSKLGYKVLPKDIPTEIKRDGKEYVLTASQKDTFSKEYSKVVAEIDKLISSSFYKSLSAKDKAYMIDYYHDKYYEMAVNKVLGITDEKKVVYDAIGFETYARFSFITKGIESDKDKNGNTISGSKKAKVIEAIAKTKISVEKRLLYLASIGYKLTDAEVSKLVKYLNSLKLRASDKKKLAEMCGFEYKNGKIYASK